MNDATLKYVLPDPAGYAEAVALLRQGEVVAYPTETVYGLAVDPRSETALEQLFILKGRPETNPVLMVIADQAQLQALVKRIDAYTQRLIDAFWPGPLTLLFPAPEGLPPQLSAGSGKIALRCPAAPIARALCYHFGGAITSTSANRSGEAPARSADEIDIPGLRLCIRGEDSGAQPPSTLYDPESDRILREGPITRAMIDTLRTSP